LDDDIMGWIGTFAAKIISVNTHMIDEWYPLVELGNGQRIGLVDQSRTIEPDSKGKCMNLFVSADLFGRAAPVLSEQRLKKIEVISYAPGTTASLLNLAGQIIHVEKYPPPTTNGADYTGGVEFIVDCGPITVGFHYSGGGSCTEDEFNNRYKLGDYVEIKRTLLFLPTRPFR
jgi:hypothetical protein